MDEDLLLDLEELGGDDELDELLEVKEEEGHLDGNDLMEEDNVTEQPTQGEGDQVYSVTKLSKSKQFKDVLQRIDHFVAVPRDPAQNTGPVEEDPEYKLIVQANNMTVEIDNEMLNVHKYIRDHYAPKFPELESLILNPIDYARTVKLIGNEMDMTKVDLKSSLPSATVMILTVTATTTNGQPLNDEEIKRVLEGCDVLLDLDAGKRKILEYVESRMSFIAPNLSALVGSNIAAKLMGLSGGVTGLSKIPASNVIVLGKVNKLNTGMSAVTQQKHQGLIYMADLVANVPQEWKRKAARRLAGKVALAARVDQARAAQDGSIGRGFREEVQKAIDLMQQPPPGKSVKALPVPDEGPKKRRAGRRFRKAKERMAQSELSKAANRVAFGVQEDEVGFQTGNTKGLGLIGGQTGKVRVTQADPRNKPQVAKKHQKMFGSSSGATSGLSSSVAFTPIKGIELENPEAAMQRVNQANNRYFGGSSFVGMAQNGKPSGAGGEKRKADDPLMGTGKKPKTDG